MKQSLLKIFPRIQCYFTAILSNLVFTFLYFKSRKTAHKRFQNSCFTFNFKRQLLFFSCFIFSYYEIKSSAKRCQTLKRSPPAYSQIRSSYFKINRFFRFLPKKNQPCCTRVRYKFQFEKWVAKRGYKYFFQHLLIKTAKKSCVDTYNAQRQWAKKKKIT